MAWREIVCPHCQQINRRGTNFVGRLRDPRRPWLCTVCATNLNTGKRSADEFVLGILGWTATYFLNALVGAGGFMLLSVAITLVWSEFFLAHPGWSSVLGSIGMIAGALLGLAHAERARRRGELHTHAKGTGEKRS